MQAWSRITSFLRSEATNPGILLHEFLSPLSNSRIDAYAVIFEGGRRRAMETYAAVRAAVGEGVPVVVRCR